MNGEVTKVVDCRVYEKDYSGCPEPYGFFRPHHWNCIWIPRHGVLQEPRYELLQKPGYAVLPVNFTGREQT